MHLNGELETIGFLLKKSTFLICWDQFLCFLANSALDDEEKGKAQKLLERANLIGFDFTDLTNVYEI